jgi:hypothetical protein
MFYPAEPDALNALIADVRKRARPDGGVSPKVVVAPHAGLVYSGSVAATAFGPWGWRAEPPRRIVIIGPAHRVAFAGIAIHPAPKWRTPLGEVPVAPIAHAKLARTLGVAIDPRPFAGEHSLEMHLITLQAMLPAPFASSSAEGSLYPPRDRPFPGQTALPPRNPAGRSPTDGLTPSTARRGIGVKARARLSNSGVSLIWGNNRLVRMTSIAASVCCAEHS